MRKTFIYGYANSKYGSLSRNIGSIRAEVNQSKSELKISITFVWSIFTRLQGIIHFSYFFMLNNISKVSFLCRNPFKASITYILLVLTLSHSLNYKKMSIIKATILINDLTL